MRIGKALGSSLLLSMAVFAQPSEEIKQLREEMEVLKEELRRLRLEISMPEVKVYEKYSGLGPAASKALLNPKGVSIGGYGEIPLEYNPDRRPRTEFDTFRVVLYLGYAFDEKLKFNSEIEFEHVDELAVEFAFLDYRFKKELGLRGGLLMIPIGIVNEVHEPPTFMPVNRPYLERNLIPTLWRENGVGIYGSVGNFSYNAYIINGMSTRNPDKFKNSAPLYGLRQQGKEAASDSPAFAGRVEYSLPKGALISASVVITGVQDKNGDTLGRIDVFSPKFEWQYAGFDIRALGFLASVEGAEKITSSLRSGGAGDAVFPESMRGFYVQVAYNVLRFTDIEQELYLFGLFEYINTHADVPANYSKPEGSELNIYNFGISYKPHPLIALKADYVREDYRDGKEDQDIYRTAITWMF